MIQGLSLAQLVQKAQEGDKDAFENVYFLTNNKIYYLALKLVKNPDDALDIVQDSYIAAFSNLNTLKNPEAFLSWMYKITANNCNRFFMKNKDSISFDDEDNNSMNTIAEEDHEFLPQAAMDNIESHRLIMNIVDRLPDAQRASIILYYFSEMSVSEIAGIMECSEGTVKSRLNYGRKYIKQAILDLEEKEDTKLYPLLPFGAVARLFQDIPQDLFSSTNATDIIWDKIASRTPEVGSTAAGGIKAESNIGSSTAKYGILSTIKAKVITGIIGTVVAVSGITMLVNPSPAISFQDPAFEIGIREAINKPKGDIYEKDLEKIWAMEITEEGFQFIQGHEDHLSWISEESTGSIEKSYSLKDTVYLNQLSYFAVKDVWVDTLEPLSATGVENLMLYNVEVRDWDSLGSLSDLNTLHIIYPTNPSFNKLPSMTGLKKLKSFTMLPTFLDDHIVPMDISSISEAESLVVLDLGGVSIMDLSPLSQLKDLKALSLSRVILSDVTPLEGLDKLKLIDISSNQQIEGREVFRKLPSLKLLSVHDILGMSLSEEERINRQMEIQGVVVDYNHFDRDIGKEYRELMNQIHDSIR